MTKEEANAFRKEQKIKVYGQDVPHPFCSFVELFKRCALETRSFNQIQIQILYSSQRLRTLCITYAHSNAIDSDCPSCQFY